jgi:hypothetical protein
MIIVTCDLCGKSGLQPDDLYMTLEDFRPDGIEGICRSCKIVAEDYHRKLMKVTSRWIRIKLRNQLLKLRKEMGHEPTR